MRHMPLCKITWSARNQEFVGTCPDFPKLSWPDSDPAKALNGIKQLVADAIANMEENSEPMATAA